jgi:hypothetical protein
MLSFLLALFAQTAAPPAMPVTVSGLTTGPSSRVTLTNTASQPVTAWAVSTSIPKEGGRISRTIETVDGYLSEITHGLPGSSERLERLMAGQSREFTLEPLPDGATVEVIAAVLDDGTAFGDGETIQRIFAHRLEERDSFLAVIDAFNEVLAREHGEAALTALQERLTALAQRADSPPCRAALDAVRTYKARGGTPEAIDQSLKTYAEFVARQRDLAVKHSQKRGATSLPSYP